MIPILLAVVLFLCQYVGISLSYEPTAYETIVLSVIDVILVVQLYEVIRNG
jgi:hypothetical protein